VPYPGRTVRSYHLARKDVKVRRQLKNRKLEIRNVKFEKEVRKVERLATLRPLRTLRLGEKALFLRSALHTFLRPQLNFAVVCEKSWGALTSIDDAPIVLIPTIRILNGFLMSSLHHA
jgi:hypothetical protein